MSRKNTNKNEKAAQPPSVGEARRFILCRVWLCALGLYLLYFLFIFSFFNWG